METKTLNLEIGREYMPPNKATVIFSRYDNKGLVFISGTNAPDWFRYYHIPETDAALKLGKIKSDNIRSELKYHPRVLEELIMENMERKLSRILSNGGLTEVTA